MEYLLLSFYWLATGGMGRAATTFYKRLASLLSDKQNIDYNKTITCNLKINTDMYSSSQIIQV